MIAFPEIFLLTMACAILVLNPFLSKPRRWIVYAMTQLSLLGAVVGVLFFADTDRQVLLSGTYVRDILSDSSKFFLFIVAALSLVHAKGYLQIRDLFTGEYQALTLLAVIGMSILTSAQSFVTIYLGLELLALSLYALSALNRDSPIASEAAMKYFIFGALASGVLLFGISILYGMTGTLNLTQMAEILRQKSENQTILFATIFVVIGVAFKFGAVPFHAWLPDVYQGTPTAVPQLIGSAPKIAALVMAVRLFGEGMAPLLADWQPVLSVLVVISLALGNMVALAQVNFKRMLAYSAIASAGFMLLGVMIGTPGGYSAALFYAITYALAVVPAFGLLMMLARKGFDPESLEDFKGLNTRSPWYAAMMLLVMFSMAGIPPLVGFVAKFVILYEALNKGFLVISVLAVFFSVIGAYYYLRVIKLMYFDEISDYEPITVDYEIRLALSLNVVLLLLLGMFPSRLISYCAHAVGL